MNKIALYTVIILTALLSGSAYAQSPDKLYADKQYERALDAYKQMEQQQGSSAALYCDMGNCYYHLEDYASAVLCYRNALALDPYMTEANNNLQYLRHKIEDKNQADMKGKKGSMAAEEPTFFRSVYNMIAVDNSSNMWAWCAIACFVLFAICLLLYVISRSVVLKKVGFFGGMVLIVAFAIMAVFALMASSDSRFGNVAIVKDVSVILKEKPADGAEDCSTPIGKGTELKIIEERTDVAGTKWSLLHLNSENEGWVKNDSFLTFGK